MTWIARVRAGWLTGVVALFLMVMAIDAGAATYYVDSVGGNDANNGTSAATPWKTLGKVNAKTFAPGDQLLFKAGSTYTGQLWPKGSGAAGNPIVLGMYGSGNKPKITGSGTDTEVVKLHNQQYWEISNLDVTGGANNAWGVYVSLQDFGTGQHLRIRDLNVHDMPNATGGIRVTAHAGSASRWNDVLIEDNVVTRAGALGITVNGAFTGRNVWNPHTNVHIRRNRVEFSKGNDIIVIMTEGALIEHNVCRGGGGAVNADATAGIWPWSADNTVMQFNEVSDRVNVHDGQAFDSDFNTQGTIVQYNYSHNNAGGFILICDKGNAQVQGNVGNRNTIVRYNVSSNDGKNTIASEPNYAKKRGELMMIAGPTTNAQIYNNTFYVPGNLNIPIEFQDWAGFPNGTKFYNNIFYVAPGGVLKIWEGPQVVGTVWEKNCFFGTIGDNSLPANQITVDPKLVNPGAAVVDAYKLQASSPMKGAGRVIANNGGRDFWGNPVSASQPPSVGAHELAGTITPSTVSVVAGPNPAAEEGQVPGTFTITRAGGNINTALSVKFTLTGTATNGVDYQTLGTSALIPANQTSVTVTVIPIDDDLIEGDETVVLTISADAAYVIGTPAAATLVILDNDSATPTTPLVLWYKFDEAAGSPQAIDSSGRNHHSNVGTGGTFTPQGGVIDGALNLDGANHTIDVGLHNDFNLTTFTLMGWFKTSVNNKHFNIIHKGAGYGDRNYAVFVDKDSQFGLAFKCSTNTTPSNLDMFSQRKNLNDGKWHHFAVVFDDVGNTATIYINGELDITQAFTPSPELRPADRLYIGRTAAGGYAEGVLDDVRIYETALSPAEVAQLSVHAGSTFNVTRWSSVAAHARGVGEVALPISGDGKFTEPRNGGITQVVFEVDRTIDATSFSQNAVQLRGRGSDGQMLNLLGVTVTASVGAGGTSGVIEFNPALPDAARYRIDLVGVRSIQGITLGEGSSIDFASLMGDVNSDARVNAADLSWTNSRVSDPIDAADETAVRADVTRDGRVNAADLSTANSRAGKDIRALAPPE